MQTDICQIRLDFVNMVLGNPAAATGECDAAGDNLVIAAGATNLLGPSTPPTLCGTNTGQHVYVDAGTATAAATLTFTLATASTATWRIKVSQIECSSEYRPPNGCLQIPVSTADFAVTNGIYCGTFLGGNAASTLAGVVKGATGSFMFRHYVNAAATPTVAVSGFSIDVSQVPG